MPDGIKTLSTQTLQDYRTVTFRSSQTLRLRNSTEAIQFVNERGFIFFWPTKGVIMPSLWCAVAGDRPVPDNHDDPGNISWTWKDQMLDKRVWYYGRIIKKRNTMISLQMIPNFYALSPNYGDPEFEIQDQYHQGLIPLEVKLIFEALAEKGSLDTLSLRREAHLSGKNSNTSFTRALDILQRDLRLLPVGIAEVGTWRYAFIYDLTHRYYPELLEQSRFISENTARSEILASYLNSVGAASMKEIQSMFNWTSDQTHNTLEKLKTADLIVDGVQLENSSTPVVCLAKLISASAKND